ncbi:metallophosphoesterase [Paenalkalicoccus suaedae]|uniref:Metallophosphoesterase n=1 Tax=Paenalkalicoccus suaedae TaxID=2592382 RepID=A0A859FCI9_9BACI|nr:metallophosphoesterase [Paenalkalicoccus suaedae]QKS69926.1 metallophosphoesterase [Paenalkalicoccus suaedae]
MKKKIFIFILGIGLLSAFIYISNNAIQTTYVTVESDSLAPEFDDYKIVHITDLHNKRFGREQQRLTRRIIREEPDIIVFTGDLFDHRKDDLEAGFVLMEQLVAIAPTYFVTGNHEWSGGIMDDLEEELAALNVTFLRNESHTLEHDGATLSLLGIDDPRGLTASPIDVLTDMMIDVDTGSFSMLLSHRPELMDDYVDAEVNLVFTGHAHGGQFRLPFIGGLVAPNQGLFPAYTSGIHEEADTSMIVSRGLGNSIIPLRLFNRPEIVSVTLRSK